MGKRSIVVSLAAAAAAAAVCIALALPPGGERDWAGDGAPPEPVKLVFMTWGNPSHLDMYERLLDRFAELRPDIAIELESVPYPEYQQKLSVLAAGRELPDIAWAADRMIPQFRANHILADVSETARDAGFDPGDFIPSTLDMFRGEDGMLYGLPFSTPPSVMFYNADLFERAGLTPPDTLHAQGRWTWERFRESARAIAALSSGGERVYGANFFRDWKTWIQLGSYAWSHGSGPFNARMTAFAWDDDAGVATMRMLEEMMFDERSHPKVGEQAGFEGGGVGMFFDVYSYVSVARTIRDFRWNIAPLPSGPKGAVPMLGQAGYVVFEGSKHPEEAKALLRFLASREGIEATSVYFVPPRASVLNADAFLRQPGAPANVKQAVIDQMASARFQPGHVNWQAIDTAVMSGLDRLWARELTPEQTVRWVREQIEPLLREP
ncbi:ABC transporter substrate-binding protein [Paenibacillus flagellatus]|uniref:Sugar ABC transporter substrate-binding protein n=1 Tax=Paenibacillus flagellatus TaxID=2211139 RepID=A0A2V5K6N6_9BACL|nr:sugar ABC transporter substrate-binding protein [Paenibacillus flagellatus]PYI53443.1 sugar ABC transporter substrate-binding protein [Paenibacillus flagellatus]